MNPGGQPAGKEAQQNKKEAEQKIQNPEGQAKISAQEIGKTSSDVAMKLVATTGEVISSTGQALSKVPNAVISPNAVNPQSFSNADLQVLNNKSAVARINNFSQGLSGVPGGEQFRKTFETYSPSTQNIIASLGGILLFFYAIRSAAKLGPAPNYGSSAEAGKKAGETPAKALENHTKQRGETDKAVAAARKAVVNIPTPLGGSVPVSADAALTKTALDHVQNEQKMLANLNDFPEANRKALGERVKELAELQKQLTAMAKLAAAAAETPAKRLEAHTKQKDQTNKAMEEAQKGIVNVQTNFPLTMQLPVSANQEAVKIAQGNVQTELKMLQNIEANFPEPQHKQLIARAAELAQFQKRLEAMAKLPPTAPSAKKAEAEKKEAAGKVSINDAAQPFAKIGEGLAKAGSNAASGVKAAAENLTKSGTSYMKDVWDKLKAAQEKKKKEGGGA